VEEGHMGTRTHIITQIKRGDRDREKGEAEREQGEDQVGGVGSCSPATGGSSRSPHRSRGGRSQDCKGEIARAESEARRDESEAMK